MKHHGMLFLPFPNRSTRDSPHMLLHAHAAAMDWKTNSPIVVFLSCSYGCHTTCVYKFALNHVCEFAHAAARDVPAWVAGHVCRSDLLMVRQTTPVMNHDIFMGSAKPIK